MGKAIVSFFMTIALFFTSIGDLIGNVSNYRYVLDLSKIGSTVPNVVSNVNVWEMGTMFYNAENNPKYDIFRFVDYVQLMQCSGGNSTRDLFKDPSDTSTLTDYDFSRLIKNCRGILNLGAKPHLKLGNVPSKFTSGAFEGGFDVNVFPPDDFNEYYNYIKALADALVSEFGREEVLTWRFGCMTEFENSDWFYDGNKDPKASEIAFCKLYDYTVKALIDSVGPDVFVGAHCMGVTEGLWDERDFLKHVAQEINYATGEKGTRICFISMSFYDAKPGEYTSGKTLPELIAHLRKAAEKYGLYDLIYGVDEGRLLTGINSGSSDNQLLSRVTGYTWQASYDARLFTQGIKNGLDYFSSWYFLSGGLLKGYPIISYHVAENIAGFAGGKQVDVKSAHVNADRKIESDILTSYDENTHTLRLMTYNFKNDLSYNKKMNISVDVKVPGVKDGTVRITKYLIDDNCNFFDEWCNDREKYSIGNDCFSWSPDDPVLESVTTLSNTAARNLYKNQLAAKYEECASLIPVTGSTQIKDGKLHINQTLEAGTVVFYKLDFCDLL